MLFAVVLALVQAWVTWLLPEARAKMGLDFIGVGGEFCVRGQRAGRVFDGALGYTEGFAGETHLAATPEDAGALLEQVVRPGDRVLVKGSRSAGLERVLAAA